MVQRKRRSEMTHGHRHDERPIVPFYRVDDSVGYSVLRLQRRMTHPLLKPHHRRSHRMGNPELDRLVQQPPSSSACLKYVDNPFTNATG